LARVLAENAKLRDENAELREDRDILKNISAYLGDPAMTYPLIEASAGQWPVQRQCELLGVSTSGSTTPGASTARQRVHETMSAFLPWPVASSTTTTAPTAARACTAKCAVTVVRSAVAASNAPCQGTHTNVVERAIRPVALTRKNALFAGSNGGAEHWAIAMTLIATAKLNGVEPLAWLTDVLERLVSGRTKQHEIEQLLPWNWRPPGTVPLAEAA
jgi:hypothetical protein